MPDHVLFDQDEEIPDVCEWVLEKGDGQGHLRLKARRKGSYSWLHVIDIETNRLFIRQLGANSAGLSVENVW